MKKQLFLAVGISVCMSVPSCISSSVVAATAGAGALSDAASSLTDNVTSLITGNKAPATLAGDIVSLTGTTTDAAGVSQSTTDAISFAKTGITTRNLGGNNQIITYTCKNKDTGIITLSIPDGTVETYTLTFADTNDGTYTYAGHNTTGQGTFSIK
ncbi:MAG: hypothetical protein IKV82_06190 [Akkermansia sp.]|nr:hypothetical protein [Akkermansia sp.]